MVDAVGVADWEDWDDFPPPPPPPTSFCTSGASSELHCHLVEGSTVGARFNGASFPTLPIVAVCSSVVLVALLVAGFLLWRHKSKAPNLLPCKPEQPQQGDIMMGAANGVTYEDAFVARHPTRIPQGHTLMPLEILDLKLGDTPLTHLHRAPCYQSRTDPPYHHPVYEDIQSRHPHKSPKQQTTSDEDFSGQCSATSSVRGSTGGDLCRDAPSSDEEIADPPYPIQQYQSGHQPIQQYQSGHQPIQQYQTGHQPIQYPTGHQSIQQYQTGHQPIQQYPTGHQLMHQYPLHSSWSRPAEHYQENIYATIDEDEMVDYPVVVQPSPPNLPSLARPSSNSSKRHRRNKMDDNSSSYGDMMPNFHHHHQQSAFM